MKNGTEDDTFRALTKPRFDELHRNYHDWWFSKNTTRNTMDRIPFMKKYGWTWLEFVLEAKNRGVGNRL